jgi:hypothetical protein
MSECWHIARIEGSDTIVEIRDENGLTIGTVIKEDAPLIVAAPEMQEALDTIANKPIGHPEASAAQVLAQIVEIARAALAKAKEVTTP